MINDFFAFLLQLDGLFHNVYSVLLWEIRVYAKLGYLLVGIPLIMMSAFYLLWKYPYGKLWHWLVWWLIGGVLVSIFSYQIIAAQQQFAIYLFDKQNYPDCSHFVFKIVIVSGLYTLAVGFLFSLILKRIPKPQSHLPFTLKRR